MRYAIQGAPVTWSIIVRDAATKRFAIAVATRFFAVGHLVPHTRAGTGAVATQALVNPFYGRNGIALLAQGQSPEDVVKALTTADDGRDHRQLHVMDAGGRIAAHTGSQCVNWCGHVAAADVSVAGNMLAGPAVIADTLSAYLARADLPLARRLIAALKAGEAAGGDKRGKQSAALVVQGAEDWPDLSLRVDDHADPLAELGRLEAVSRERFVPFSQFIPSRRDPAGVTDRAVIEAGIAAAAAVVAHEN
jgi:uncharacterized Ntn-hydrolase superfamily protein